MKDLSDNNPIIRSSRYTLDKYRTEHAPINTNALPRHSLEIKKNVVPPRFSLPHPSSSTAGINPNERIAIFLGHRLAPRGHCARPTSIIIPTPRDAAAYIKKTSRKIFLELLEIFSKTDAHAAGYYTSLHCQHRMEVGDKTRERERKTIRGEGREKDKERVEGAKVSSRYLENVFIRGNRLLCNQCI